MLILLHERVAQQCTPRDIRIPAKFCPCNMSQRVQQVELRATCRGVKIVARFVLHENKSMNSHEGTCRRCNMSLAHVPATFSLFAAYTSYILCTTLLEVLLYLYVISVTTKHGKNLTKTNSNLNANMASICGAGIWVSYRSSFAGTVTYILYCRFSLSRHQNKNKKPFNE